MCINRKIRVCVCVCVCVCVYAWPDIYVYSVSMPLISFTCTYLYLQNLPHRYGLLQTAPQMQHSPVIDLDSEQGGKSDQECSMSSDPSESRPQQVHLSSKCLEYSVKVVPPDRKAGYQIHKLRAYTGKKFVNVEELKSQLQKSLDERISDESAMNFGYIEPSKQGVRSKMRWIFTADDLKDMYAA